MNVIRLVPPMVSTDAQIDQGLSILNKVLRSASHAVMPAARAAE
jgi:4-aminobutyrate aminotransferase-like enzyme